MEKKGSQKDQASDRHFLLELKLKNKIEMWNYLNNQ